MTQLECHAHLQLLLQNNSVHNFSIKSSSSRQEWAGHKQIGFFFPQDVSSQAFLPILGRVIVSPPVCLSAFWPSDLPLTQFTVLCLQHFRTS